VDVWVRAVVQPQVSLRMALAPSRLGGHGWWAVVSPRCRCARRCPFWSGVSVWAGQWVQPQVSLRMALAPSRSGRAWTVGGVSPRCRCASGRILPDLGKPVWIAVYRLKLSTHCHDAAALRRCRQLRFRHSRRSSRRVTPLVFQASPLGVCRSTWPEMPHKFLMPEMPVTR
jgi:hypothetical protein